MTPRSTALLLVALILEPSHAGFRDFFSRSLRDASGECERSIDRVRDLTTKMASMSNEAQQLTATLVSNAGEKGVFPKRLQDRAGRFSRQALEATRSFGEMTLTLAKHGLDFLANVDPICAEACPALFHVAAGSAASSATVAPAALQLDELAGDGEALNARPPSARTSGSARWMPPSAHANATSAGRQFAAELMASQEVETLLATTALLPQGVHAASRRGSPTGRELQARESLYTSAGDFESECQRYLDRLQELLTASDEETRSFVEYARFVRFSGRAFRRGGIEMVREVSRFTDRNLQLTLAMQRELSEAIRAQQSLGRSLRRIAGEALEVCRDCDIELPVETAVGVES